MEASDPPNTLSNLSLKLESRPGVSEIPVHRYSVRPTYGEGWPLTITLAQFSSAGRATRAVAIRVEPDAARAFLATVSDGFKSTLRKNARRDHSGLELGKVEWSDLEHLSPEFWVNLTLAAAGTATSFTGADIEWYQLSPLAINQHMQQHKKREADNLPDAPIAAAAVLRTPMNSACLLGLIVALESAVSEAGGDS